MHAPLPIVALQAASSAFQGAGSVPVVLNAARAFLAFLRDPDKQQPGYIDHAEEEIGF
jgi:hypothetical protein